MADVSDFHGVSSNVLSIGTHDDAQARMLLDFIRTCTSSGPNTGRKFSFKI